MCGGGGGALKNICVTKSGKVQKQYLYICVCEYGDGVMKNRLVCVGVCGGGRV